LHINVQADVAVFKKAQAQQAHNMNPSELGGGEDTVYRDRKGRKLEMLNEMIKQDKREGSGRGPTPTWGKGLVQQRSKEEQRDYERREAAKPLARYEDDAERDAEKRAVERWGDPMLGRTSMDKGKVNKPKYCGPPAPPNRFGIMPGHKWDGVDRSNGYEKEFFKAKGLADARAAQAFMWAVEDM